MVASESIDFGSLAGPATDLQERKRKRRFGWIVRRKAKAKIELCVARQIFGLKDSKTERTLVGVTSRKRGALTR